MKTAIKEGGLRISREMNKYQNGKVYLITDLNYTKIYYGSTCESLSQRMARHRYSYERHLRGKYGKIQVFDLFDEFGIENCKIELAEHCACNSKEELLKCEGSYIRNNECVNKKQVSRTPKEYREEKHEYIQFQRNIYKELHPDKIKEQQHKKYLKLKNKLFEPKICGCGKQYTPHHFKRHEKSQKHQNWLKQKEQQEQQEEQLEEEK